MQGNRSRAASDRRHRQALRRAPSRWPAGFDGRARDAATRRDRAAWYAPPPLEQYELYRDDSSVGYVHMLVRREPGPDGRHRVFLSKH